MNLSGSGAVYAFMIIPALFVVVILVQGIEKMVKHEPDGPVAIGFAILFIILIAAAYFLYIK